MQTSVASTRSKVPGVTLRHFLQRTCSTAQMNSDACSYATGSAHKVDEGAFNELSALMRRLEDRQDSVESRLEELLVELQRMKEVMNKHWPPESKHRNDAVPNDTGPKEEDESQENGSAEESQAALLHKKLTEFLNSGYLQSVKRMRERLMAQEWEMTAKLWAQQKGVSEFEKMCVDKEYEVEYDAITQLYSDPQNNLHVINDHKLRMLARSCIIQAMAEDRMTIYDKSNETAKQMASILSSQDAGGWLLGLTKRLLPIPGLK